MPPKNSLLFVAGLITIFILANMAQQGARETAHVPEGEGYASMLIPAVDSKGEGLVTNLTVQVKPGSGRSLVDINDLSFWVDTQNSIRTAKDVAEKVTGIGLNNYDIVYSIVTNASAVEGPSAGSAIAIATVAALQDKKLRHDAMITGTINPDGSIGKVGDVVQKAAAAKSLNATLFLVPVGQLTQTVSGYEKLCKNYLFSKICSSAWRTREISLEKDVGIRVVEVKDIKDALGYMVIQ
ncbi:MAG: hypothetical protein HY516_04165 [Candidatus Aenigmarchaeota archaeon]|nr:hypothetical protein [Candidatus Aenigmarchaeota archaeon]